MTHSEQGTQTKMPIPVTAREDTWDELSSQRIGTEHAEQAFSLFDSFIIIFAQFC